MKPGHIAKRPLMVFITISFFITFLLAFIDEGKYNFQWVWSAKSWISVLMYVLVFLASQIFVYKVLLDGRSEKTKIWMSPPIAIFMLGIVLWLLVLFNR